MAISDNSFVYLTKKLWQFTDNKKNIILYVILFTIANMIDFLTPLVVAHLLNTIQEQGLQNITQLLGISTLFIIIMAGFWLFHGPARVIEQKNAFTVRANYKKYLLNGVLSLPAKWHTEHQSGDTIDKIDKGSRALYAYSGETFLTIEMIVRLLSAYIALTFFNIHSAYIVLAMVITTGIAIIKYDKILTTKYKKLYSAENTISSKIFDTISNITTIIILRLEKLVSKEIIKKIIQPYNLENETNKTNEKKWAIVSLSTAIMTTLVLATYLGKNYLAGTTIMIGTLAALYGYVQRISELFYQFAWRYGNIVKWHSQVKNSEELSRDFQIKQKTKQTPLTTPWSELTIQNLNFNYGDEEGELHLKNVTITIKRKEKIAFVGQSGSGKTTFLKLIRGLYKPRTATVLLDNKKIQGLEAINEQITLIPQEPELFATTIKDNITMGVSYDDYTIRKYVHLAKFSQVVQRLPKKYRSTISEKGVNLSGGEKQRLALARGLLAAQDKPIVLLDEPTSSIDAKNELAIYKNIFKTFKNKTIISSIHRLHLLPRFDKIVFFKKGKIQAQGTLKDVLKNQEFNTIWQKYTKANK